MMHFALITLGHPEGAILPGCRIKEGKFSQEQLDRFISKGYVKSIAPDVPAPAPEKKEDQSGQPTPTWNFKREDLQGKSIEELNMMALERATTMHADEPPTFEDVETAIEFMSCEA